PVHKAAVGAHAVLVLVVVTEDELILLSFYDTLNVERTASDTQIKKSFRSLAARYHPDKNKSAQAETTFREIAEGKRCCNTLALICNGFLLYSKSIRAERLCVRI
uniref:DnaJ homolog subfamily B member 9 n=1 Tax=Poecilia reticulata TaxID=8081 RepID=A0A3P9PLH1_POERE